MKKINVVFALLYITGLAVIGYALYQLPTNLVEAHAIHLTQLKQAQPVFDQLYVMVGISLAFGAASLIGVWLMQQNSSVADVNVLRTDQDDAHRGYEEGDRNEVEENTLQVEGLEEIINSVDDEEEVFTKALSLVCHSIEASQAVAYRTKHTEEYGYIELLASFAYHTPEGEKVTYRFGEGLAGQVAKQGEVIVMDAIPEGYLEILSGLGKASPTHLMIIPIKHDNQVVGVVEIASFKEFSAPQKSGLPPVFNRLALKLLNNDNVSLAKATS